MVAAAAGERLGFPHNPPAAVAATRDKAAMRGRSPPPRCRSPLRGDRRTASSPTPADSSGSPAVLKPVGLSASQGVIRADDADGGAAAATRIRARRATARC